MKFTPQQLLRLAALINQAVDLPETERITWLNRLPDLDPADRLALERVFSRDTSADFTITLPKMKLPIDVQAVGEHASLRSTDVQPGERFGAWRAERVLGVGGMGQVWLAARSDGRYDGFAAIKLIRTAASEAVQRRFAVEGKLLARLEHPNIARLLDAGEREGGGSFLVLEYVEGVRIDAWADGRKLSLQERLALFLQICSAVSYAHANLVVHRDIKPSNILVLDNGQVKLLDFGVAKLIAEDGGSELTIEAGVGLTPDYASPEQLESRPISVASDVYSLGVLLFRLLAGVSPYALKQPSRLQLARAVVDEAPRRLSTASNTESLARSTYGTAGTDVPSSSRDDAPPATPERIAESRSTTPDRLMRALAGDLDTILATALKKAPAERYSSVQAFADDVQRHLRHQPIRAQADSWTYRARKFARRNWVALGASGVLSIAIISGVSATLWQA